MLKTTWSKFSYSFCILLLASCVSVAMAAQGATGIEAVLRYQYYLADWMVNKEARLIGKGLSTGALPASFIEFTRYTIPEDLRSAFNPPAGTEGDFKDLKQILSVDIVKLGKDACLWGLDNINGRYNPSLLMDGWIDQVKKGNSVTVPQTNHGTVTDGLNARFIEVVQKGKAAIPDVVKIVPHQIRLLAEVGLMRRIDAEKGYLGDMADSKHLKKYAITIVTTPGQFPYPGGFLTWDKLDVEATAATVNLGGTEAENAHERKNIENTIKQIQQKNSRSKSHRLIWEKFENLAFELNENCT